MSALHLLVRLVALVALTLSPIAHAQPYPTRPIRLIVPDAPGGSPDQLARLLAKALSESLGQQVFVDNRPGAAGVLATDTAAKAPPDGYTIAMTTTAIYAILPNLKKDLPYDPVKDFIPVSRIATASNVLVVNVSLPAKSVAELIQYAKQRPGELNYASAGVGSPAHLAGEMLNLLAGIKLTHIPYKGSAPALLDVIAGNAQIMITSPIAAGAHMNNGRVRALATTGTERNPALPDLPTVAETVPGYEITQSWGIAVPAGTPPAIVTRLADEIGKAMRQPDVRDKVQATGAVPVGDSPQAFTAFMAKERQRLGDVIAKSGIVLND
ncbi:MAG TPA: tripartite tricarboxylate transporter substrate binding protein [Casimicrobiaceae bacterium]|jgi:tripartite-type tricarboxylate transporter receptor subunit TctC|nr:tripartite tricarboxylate transporter substrate binding protein [Casimicrobiaceae bacterium]